MYTKYRYSLAILFVWALILVGCSEDQKEPSDGFDNHLLSFVLTSNGTEYVGSITATDEVLIKIPYETDLSTAKVTYRISEMARILPNPQTITNWNEEHVFNVISQSGEKRTYVVRIVQINEVSEKDVILSTDDEVKAFVKRGVDKIKGSLIIGKPSGVDSISNIDALTLLKEVDYDIVINSTYKGKDLSGLRNVKSLGSLIINDPAHLEKIKMPSLEHVRQNVTIKSSTVDDLNLPRIQNIGGDLSLELPKVTKLEWPALKSMGSLKLKSKVLTTLKATKLQRIEGEFNFSEAERLSTFNMKGLKYVGGDFMLSKASQLGMVLLPELAEVQGKVNINNSGARDIHFPKLERAVSFTILNNQSLKELSAPMLTEVQKDFTIQGAGLQKLSNFVLSNVGGTLSLSDLSMLQTVGDLFHNIEHADVIDIKNTLIGGSLDLSRIDINKIKVTSCSNLTEIILPKKLEEFTFSGTPSFKHAKLTNFRGLKEAGKFWLTNYVVDKPTELIIPDLETVSESLRVNVGNITSVTFESLQKSKNIDLNMTTSWYKQNEPISEVVPIEIISAPKLVEVERMSCNEPWLHTLDFPELTTMGSLKIQCYWPFQKNDKITGLNKMPKLSSLTSVTFQNLVVYEDYSFLKTVVENGSLTDLSIRNCLYAPSLDDLKEGKYVKP